jgi:hypothetical protein
MEAHVNFVNLDLLIGSLMNYHRWGLIDISDIFGPRFDRINIFYTTPEFYAKLSTKRRSRRGRQRQPVWKLLYIGP